MSSAPMNYPPPLGPLPSNRLCTTAAAAVRLRRRLHLGSLLRSSLKGISHLGDVPHLSKLFHQRGLQSAGFDHFQCSFNALSATLMGLSFFNGDESRNSYNDTGKSHNPGTSRGDLFDNKRKWTNILLAANLLFYVAQTFSHGKVLYWGAKINSLISEGQLWRLATSSFLHANIGHLMVNCYSLNSMGPTVENICGPRRYLTIYLTSAITGSAMSYWFSKSPAVGASGAIFGLVGSFAIFVLRHRGIFKGTGGELKHLAQVILLNMGIGLLSQRIDNWGHAGGLIGGAAISWLLGPAWEVQSISRDGRTVLKDKAPIFSLIKR